MSARPDLSDVDIIAPALAKLAAVGSSDRSEPLPMTTIAMPIDAAEAQDLREMCDDRTRVIAARIATAKDAATLTHWQKRKLVHEALVVKVLVLLMQAEL